jgi:hypothetical protein
MDPCPPPAPDLIAQLQSAVDRNDLRKLLTLTRKNKEWLVIAPERNAIQVLNCKGEAIIGQITVPNAVISRIAAAD